MKEFFLQNALLTPSEVCKNLDKLFNQWKGTEEQTDDLLIAGIKTFGNKT